MSAKSHEPLRICDGSIGTLDQNDLPPSSSAVICLSVCLSVYLYLYIYIDIEIDIDISILISTSISI